MAIAHNNIFCNYNVIYLVFDKSLQHYCSSPSMKNSFFNYSALDFIQVYFYNVFFYIPVHLMSYTVQVFVENTLAIFMCSLESVWSYNYNYVLCFYFSKPYLCSIQKYEDYLSVAYTISLLFNTGTHSHIPVAIFKFYNKKIQLLTDNLFLHLSLFILNMCILHISTYGMLSPTPVLSQIVLMSSAAFLRWNFSLFFHLLSELILVYIKYIFGKCNQIICILLYV